MQKDKYMSYAIDLASRADTQVKSNPMVGCVIVHDDRVIGHGWHRRFGEAHAEINALNSVSDNDRSLLHNSVLYVNLEPCSHHGKTPPCCDAIIRAGIPKVVIGMEDPFERVAGEGIRKLRAAGIEVICGVMKEESTFLNRRFITFHSKKRPYIIFKWAQTLDGYIDGCREQGEKPIWLTNSHCKRLVHKWRSQECAIMVGTNTVCNDNPSLTNRLWMGPSPLRVVFDRSARLDDNMAVFSSCGDTLVFTNRTIKKKNISISSFTDNMSEVLDYLYKRDVVSLFVEGGTMLFNSLIRDSFLDEARIFVSPKMLSDIGYTKGVSAPLMPPHIKEEHFVVDDIILKHLYF